MAIVGDYMVNGNCTVCGKYLPKGTLCCDEIVQSNYNKWWDEMQKKKEDQQPALVLNVRKRSIGTGIRGIKDLMKESGPKFFADVVAKNNRLREEEKSMKKEYYVLRIYNSECGLVNEHTSKEKYEIMNKIYLAISDRDFVLQDLDIVETGLPDDVITLYKVTGRFVR
ncbi:hypothetical protein [Bacillus phage vB_BceM_Bc431v3]|uniref:Uncharacterized protein n=1 Tax=Bacillus phage vB_BceM_Bc431v3 TaxID=1195072 RepID=M4HPV8_9CAUD|nr:hypothetical protein K201_gp067 [Bacillus phage vB_BceM_Bc431v3]AFQ96375.1 hypothetical protein [Bacillus phage vB_BceM_Bc431v3]